MQELGWKKHIPNFFTLSRIAAVPFIIGVLLWDEKMGGYYAAALFLAASFTDFLDGYTARTLQIESTFGKLMDPIADKILVTSTLVMLIPVDRLSAVMVIILLARDTLIGGLRSIAAAENYVISAGIVGKSKTALQMVAIPAVLVKTPLLGIPLYEIGYWTLWFSVALSVISGLSYGWVYWQRARKA
jgi:CDP-diacylglycerol--glycerol-3-phosphate 3-phosphatidyltransferase